MLVQGNQGQTGKETGLAQVAGLGETSELNPSLLQPRYYAQNYRSNTFTASTPGAGVTLANANLFSTAIASFQPILGLYNPLSSLVNLVITHAWFGVSGSPASATTTGAFFWVGNSGQNISNATGTAPFNCKTLAAAGSRTVVINNATMTGAVGNPLLLGPVSSNVVPLTEPGANTSLGNTILEEVAGSLMVPPGGYLGFASGAVAAVPSIVVASIRWSEVAA
jgi:hypothetical protein